MANLLEVSGLEGGYGPTQVLFGLDFTVRQGGITTILGANGAGKTTTLRAVCGMIKVTGNISFDGARIDAVSEGDFIGIGARGTIVAWRSGNAIVREDT